MRKMGYLVNHFTFSKLIVFQASFALGDGKASSIREDPFVAFLETDAAVAFCDRSELWDRDAEFEGAAVAIARVRLEIWFLHWNNGL